MEKQAEKRSFLNQKTFKMGVTSENFILTRTVECGLERGNLARVYFGDTMWFGEQKVDFDHKMLWFTSQK